MNTLERTTALTRSLREHGLRVTPQRLEIIRAVASLSMHPSADDVFQAVRVAHPTLSLATVYNTLDVLAKTGVVHEVEGLAERRFDGRNPEPHAHLLCRRCGLIEDLALPEGWQSLPRQGEARGFDVEKMHITLFGLCASCQNREQPDAARAGPVGITVPKIFAE